MKYIITFISIWLILPVSAICQPADLPRRQAEISLLADAAYSVNEFRRIADSLQMTDSELSDYPVLFPVKSPRISSGYGRRTHPISKVKKFHRGIDFSDIKGTPVFATGNGIVSRKGYDSGYGYYLEIQHASGFRSFYAHLSRTLVSKGDSVRIGNYIACVGNSGRVTGFHLHYEVRKGKRFLNPLDWCLCLYEVLKSRELGDVQLNKTV